MPIFFQKHIDRETRLAIWKIEEDEAFFNVPLQRDITHPHKRLQHLAGRYLLRYLFADFPLELIKIADTRKPYLEDEAYHFSISHCGDYAAAIASKSNRVGIDIEVPSPKVEKIKHKFLHPEELEMVDSRLENESRGLGNTDEVYSRTLTETAENILPKSNTKLTLLWSAKEAVFKWWSYGSVDFSEMIRVEPFQLNEVGEIKAHFTSPEKKHPLHLHYRMFDGICLAYLASEHS